MKVHVFLWLAVWVIATCGIGAFAQSKELSDADIKDLTVKVMFSSKEQTQQALDTLEQRGKKDVVASLILAMRYIRTDEAIKKTISALTGTQINSWNDAMLWQEANPQVIPHASYRDAKLTIFSQIDPNFMQFLGGDRSQRENLDIRLEEIAWGGVGVDGIPSLDNPKLINADAAAYLKDDDLVFGVSINGDSRAFPLRIMGWHEMFNDVIGGEPAALAYCTLCGAGILFETKVEGRKEPLIFGSSGLLYRSNKLMFDRETRSLWNQFTGEPVSGPLRGSGIKLKIRPVTITSWKRWRSSNPQTRVLSVDTGYRRDYGPGVVYREYFSSPELMFPAIVRDESVLLRKDYVFGIRDVGASKAWPIKAFGSEKIINDKIGTRNIVLIGNDETRTVRAYDRDNHIFDVNSASTLKDRQGRLWTVSETDLRSPSGKRLARVPGHVSYWFAWDGYMGVKSELYQADKAQ